GKLCNQVSHEKEEIKGIGAWILLAPYKILACYRTDLWKDAALDTVLFPLGFQVIRGVKFLHKEGLRVSYYDDLYEDEKSLGIDLGTTALVQGYEAELADIADSRILHINSGLFKLGAGK
ncbi:MAG TPA: hypothetical protein VMR41_01200, partial [Patescibacteria group bacterium]|nr:hypothetical protein [Patescibacteria group bacterium]